MVAAERSGALSRQETEFQAHVLENIGQAEDLMAGYRFTKLRSMIDKLGAVETAKRLLDPSNVSHPYDGFNTLAIWELLPYSLEQAVVDWAGSGLFHSSLVAAAEIRIKIASRPKHLIS